jgi:hypothetical protein
MTTFSAYMSTKEWAERDKSKDVLFFLKRKKEKEYGRRAKTHWPTPFGMEVVSY